MPHILTLAAFRTEADKMKKETEEWDKKALHLPDSAQRIWRRAKNELRYKERLFEREYHWLIAIGARGGDKVLWVRRRRDLSRAFISWRGALLKNISFIRDKRPTDEHKQGFTFP